MLRKLLALADSVWVWLVLAMWGLAYTVYGACYLTFAFYRWIR